MNQECYCGAALLPARIVDDRISAEECPACGYARTRFVQSPDRREIQEQHPSAYQGHDGARFGTFIATARQVLAGLRVRGSSLGKGLGRILDFGCGQGYFLGALKATGQPCVGVEISEVTARRAIAQGFQVECSMDAFADQSFDAVASVHVIEHLPAPEEILAGLRRVLKPGARFYFEVPNRGSWQGRLFGERWLHAEGGLHIHQFTEAAFAGMLNGCGYQIERVGTYSFEHGLLGWVQSCYNLLFPYNRFFRNVILNRPMRDKLQCWPEFLLFPLLILPCGLLLVLEALAGRGAVLRAEGRLVVLPA